MLSEFVESCKVYRRGQVVSYMWILYYMHLDRLLFVHHVFFKKGAQIYLFFIYKKCLLLGFSFPTFQYAHKEKHVVFIRFAHHFGFIQQHNQPARLMFTHWPLSLVFTVFQRTCDTLLHVLFYCLYPTQCMSSMWHHRFTIYLIRCF